MDAALTRFSPLSSPHLPSAKGARSGLWRCFPRLAPTLPEGPRGQVSGLVRSLLKDVSGSITISTPSCKELWGQWSYKHTPRSLCPLFHLHTWVMNTRWQVSAKGQRPKHLPGVTATLLELSFICAQMDRERKVRADPSVCQEGPLAPGHTS